MTKILSNKSNIDLDYPICRPSLDLDFTQEVLDPRITFSRGSIGTRVNRNRLIETVSANQPRFDYDPVTGECRGLLIEESRSNYFWGTQTGTGGSVSDGTATGADGVTAKKFVPTLGSAAFPSLANYTAYTFTAVSGGTVDVSFSGYFAATGTGLYVPDIVIQFDTDGSSNYIFAELLPNLTNGTVWTKGGIGANGVTELIAPQITLMPFGMYKVTWSVRYTQGATTRNRASFYIQCRRKGSTFGSNTGTYYADGVNGFQFSCVQYEIGAFPTSYIPTVASTVTRSVDNVEMTGTNFSSWFNSTEGTIYTQAKSIATISSGTRRFLEFVNGSGTERYLLGYSTTSSARFLVTALGVNQADISVTASLSNGVKICGSYTTNNFSSAVNGTLGTRDVAGLVSNPIRITFGSDPFLTANTILSGTISRLTYYPRRLKDNQLVLLTQ